MNARQCLFTIKDRLEKAGIESADYESRVFLEWLAGIGRADYYMDPDREIAPDVWEKTDRMVTRRQNREPLQYLMGSCEFMGYEFYVDSRVLIPRQDTEVLVELALDKIKEKGSTGKVLDLCCGSGCIGISIKKMAPGMEVTLADISEDALAVSVKNAGKLDAKVTFIKSDLFSQIPDTYDVILSNPPYIPTEVCGKLMPEVKDHEPILALDGCVDGLAFYRRITEEAPNHLTSGGHLIFEIGADQGEAVSALMKEKGFCNVLVHKDLAGLDRVVSGEEP